MTLFDSWAALARVLVNGASAYVALVVLLRLSGKRTLSKMNAFDLVVTVALGSTLATIVTSSQIALATGVLALALLVALQYGVAWLSSRWPRVDAVVKSRPRVLFHAGVFSGDALRDERITEDEVRAAIRQASVGSVDEVESVVLESSGDLAVVRGAPGDRRARRDLLEGVRLDARLRDAARRREGGRRGPRPDATRSEH